VDVGRIVARAAQDNRDRVALELGPERRTFGEVGERVARLARGLLELGLEPGDRVLDLQTNRLTYVETDYGLATAGLVRVALNYRLTPADWLRIAEDCGARALIYEDRFADRVDELVELVTHAVVIGDASPGIPYETLLARSSSSPLLLGIDADALVSLNYSSGTTGNPKGSRRTHRNRSASLQNIVADIVQGLPGWDDAWCHAGPLTHASGLFSLPHFAFGARQIVLSTWDAEALVEAVADRGATGTVLVPTMVARLLAHAPGLDSLAGLRRLVYAGAPMPPEQVRRALAELTPSLVQMYGLVEAIPPVTVLSAADHRLGLEARPELLASAGKPCFGVELRVIDDLGADVRAGDVGEVLTRGDHVMGGYWGSVDPTAAKGVTDGWLHTGDLGYLDEEGRLYLVDRKGEMIITGGYNVYPREVEDVIAELPGVGEVAVVGVADDEWGQSVTALYTLRDAAGVDPDTVLEHCRERLASFKKPKDVRAVDSFPLTSTGKIDKKLLRRRLEDERTDV
jgi:acyl-CoA synthetase (AMP-forming)/AMP-acid ligase II